MIDANRAELERFLAENGMGWTEDVVADLPAWVQLEPRKFIMYQEEWHPLTDLSQAMMLAMHLVRQYGPDGDAYDVGVLMYSTHTLCFISELQDYAVRVEIQGPPEIAAPEAICLAVARAMGWEG